MTFLDITKPAASTSRAVHSPSLAAHNRQLRTIVLNTWKAAAGRDRTHTGTGSKHLTLKHTVLWRQAVEHCRAGGAQGAGVARRAGIGSGRHFTTEPDPLAGRPPAVTAAQQHSADPTDIMVTHARLILGMQSCPKDPDTVLLRCPMPWGCAPRTRSTYTSMLGHTAKRAA